MATLVIALFVLWPFTTVRSVWADTINPNPPISAQPFTISGTYSGTGAWHVYIGFCGSIQVASGVDPTSGVLTPYTDHIPGLHALFYAFIHDGDPSGCMFFIISLATPTVSVICGSSVVTVGFSTTCTATIIGAAYAPLAAETVSWSNPTGSVSFSSGTCTIFGLSCGVTVTGTGTGLASVDASYAGDPDNNPVQGSATLVIYPVGFIHANSIVIVSLNRGRYQ